MKTLLSFFATILVVAVSISADAQNERTARQSFDPKSISQVKVFGKSNVTWVHDTDTYVQVLWLTYEQPSSSYFISMRDNVLNFNDTIGQYIYELHLDSNAKISVSVDNESKFTYPSGKTIRVMETSSSTLYEIANDIKGLIDELVETYDSVSRSGGNVDGSQWTYRNKATKKSYSVGDRTSFKFHWAFNNWGDKWYNGLMKLDGPYNLRTSFSSYQLSENYAVVMTQHTKLSIGLGYESDVYKFSDHYVDMDMNDGSLYTVNQPNFDGVNTSLGDWSTRLVTRYVTMPIEFEYRDKGKIGSFRISLGVVPGLSFNSKHTGLRHELEQRGRNATRDNDISKYINPYKLDVRLTFKRKLIGVFVQVPTLPLFIDTGTKVYPIKIGFVF